MWVAPAVAKAAIESGVAQAPLTDMKAYVDRLEALRGAKVGFVRTIINRVKQKISG